MFSSTGAVSFVLVIVRVIRASEGGANYIGDRERCSRPTMEIALPNPPPPCPPSLLLATNDPSLLPPRRRRTFSRQTAAPSTIPPSTAFPTRRGKKNRTELFPIRIERGARNSSLHPSKSVRYVNRGGRGNRGEDLDPFTPPPSLFR